MTSKTKTMMFAMLSATLLISTVSMNSAFAVTSFNDIMDINPHCAHGSGPELYVSGTMDATDDEIFIAWAADPSFYKNTGWFGTCNTLVTYDSLDVKISKYGPLGLEWSETHSLGSSASSSDTLELSNDIPSSGCLTFGYTIKYSGQDFTEYPNNHLNCL